MNKKRPIIIVDGLNIFIRSFMVNEAVNSYSEPIGGVYGFLRFLNNVLDRWSPSKIIVVWEAGGGCPRRKQIYPGYKGNRGKVKAFSKNDMKEVLRNDNENKIKQLSILYNLLKHTSICQIFIKETECDDIIGYLIKYVYQNDNCLKLIFSSDKDFYQLLEDDNVNIFDPARKITIDKNYVLEKFNIHPKQICLARTIAGDPSDNIDGVPGIGLKTLAKRFKCLQEGTKDLNLGDILVESENILKANQKLQAPKDIIACQDLIKRNWKLMYLSSNNLAAYQIEKIHGTLDQHELKLDKFAFMKEASKNGLNIPFDFNNFCNLLKQNLFYE